ncbi:uncharacterized protein LOC119109828 [Pollicipes pollicipes]|uniref:uncharacterized protein LOC119109828 n=1 Tax=Pollicipes pollicipes TaxID=41117 RepID=UPI001884C4B6|nr:uncharacterized protein LOC119109828 [Pollicipes pollicipes]
MTVYYHWFIPHAATIMKPLHKLLSLGPGGKKSPGRPVPWVGDAVAAFQCTKDALADASRLPHPVPDAPLSVQVDAFSIGIGMCYSTFGRAVEGHSLIVNTDHKSLIYAVGTCSARHSPRETHHLHFIVQFTTDVHFVRGQNNVAADALSRTVSMPSLPQPALDDFSVMADAQREDPILAAFPQSQDSLTLRDAVLANGHTFLTDKSTVASRSWVPSPLLRHVVRLLHILAHPDVPATTEVMTRRFVRPNMKRNIRVWTQACIRCQRTKALQHTESPVALFDAPGERFGTVHVGIVGPLLPSDGYTHLPTCVDRSTRRVKVIPLRDTCTPADERAFVGGWIARFGVPTQVTTNCGIQAELALLAELSCFLGCKRRRTTSYHPQANGLVERMHRQLKTALPVNGQATWTDVLPLIMLGMRSAVKTDLGCAAADMVYGASPRLPREFFMAPSREVAPTPASYAADLCRAMQQLRAVPPRAACSPSHVPSAPHDAKHVFLRRDATKPPLGCGCDEPFRVTWPRR